jgi:hypothetical protein
LTTVSQIFSQLAFSGVMRLGGIITDCCSNDPFPFALNSGFYAASIICSAYIVETILQIIRVSTAKQALSNGTGLGSAIG